MSNYASVNFYPEITHTGDCGGVLNVERIGSTSEQKLRVQGHCKSCDAYLYCDIPLAKLTANCPAPLNVEMALQIVPPLPKGKITDEDTKLLKEMKIAVD